MLFNCPKIYQHSSPSSQNHISLHPTKPIIAYESSQNLEIINFNLKGLVICINIGEDINQIEFTPCGTYVMIVTLQNGSPSLILIDYEKQTKICEPIQVFNCDKIRLTPNKTIMVHYSYSKVKQNQIKYILILQSYTLKTKANGGYSMHIYELEPQNDKKFSNSFNQYISGGESPLMLYVQEQYKDPLLKNQVGQTRVLLAENQTIKTVEIDQEALKARIIKQVRGGLLYEQKHHEQNGKFTVFCIRNAILYSGCEKGSIVVFDLLNGQFIKQIPFQPKLLKPYFIEYHKQPLRGVLKISINKNDQLLTVFNDFSYQLLDQTSKAIFKYHQSIPGNISSLKFLPLDKTDCYFASSDNNQILIYQKNEISFQYEYHILSLNDKAFKYFDIEDQLNFLAIANDKNIKTLDLKEFQETNTYEIKDQKEGFKLNDFKVIDTDTFLIKSNKDNQILKVINQELVSIYKVENSDEKDLNKVSILSNNYTSSSQDIQLIKQSRRDLLELYEIIIYQDHLLSSSLQLYHIEGKIVDYQIHHPSSQYLIVLSSDGYYYIFDVQNGDIRGKVKISSESQRMQIDHSGLYVMIQYAKSKLSIYEIATGVKVFDQSTKFSQIGEFKWSRNHEEFIVTDKSRLNLTIYQLDQKISSKILRVTGMMQLDSQFWNKYPIQLQTTKELSDNERQILRNLKKQEDTQNQSNYHPFLDKSIRQATQYLNKSMERQNQFNINYDARSTKNSGNKNDYLQNSKIMVDDRVSMHKSDVYSQFNDRLQQSKQQSVNYSVLTQPPKSYYSQSRPQSRFQRVYQTEFMNNSYKDTLNYPIKQQQPILLQQQMYGNQHLEQQQYQQFTQFYPSSQTVDQDIYGTIQPTIQVSQQYQQQPIRYVTQSQSMLSQQNPLDIQLKETELKFLRPHAKTQISDLSDVRIPQEAISTIAPAETNPILYANSLNQNQPLIIPQNEKIPIKDQILELTINQRESSEKGSVKNLVLDNPQLNTIQQIETIQSQKDDYVNLQTPKKNLIDELQKQPSNAFQDSMRENQQQSNYGVADDPEDIDADIDDEDQNE
ncbi:UNKNOWN [Stylonychia lemnae]|uniref:Uncharacterized protein n=1 Tax=Stylonychia lemnae TaxID=5949 RepID=A0A078AHZ6_STYLE|nr:UNKNOWN [Stylonychia lemnae]|eukprot:CDW81551.1 UNKNOWN [Stylonychia lemnae]